MSSSEHPRSSMSRHAALVLIDLINTWEMKEGPALLRQTLATLPALTRLLRRVRRAGVPVIYANDNFGRWRSNMPAIVELARGRNPASGRVVEALAPNAGDYFVLKPEHSAFFATPLGRLLQNLEVKRLVLAGVAGDQCVLATASDALIRDFEVVIPRDTLVCATAARRRAVLRHFNAAMDIATPPSGRLLWLPRA